MAAETRRPITIEDLGRLRLVGPPQLSPDGARVAYVVTTIHADGDDNEYRSTIAIAPADGSAAPRQLTAGPKKDTQPRWSPDGAKLAFVSDRAGKPQVYVLDLAGGEARRLTDAPEGASNPLWSPDGATILYSSKVAEGDDAAEKAEGERKPEGKGGAYKPPLVIDRIKHKMDGEGFFDEQRRHLFLIPAAGGEARQLTSGDWNDNTPAWSPDGARIAFCANRDADRDTSDVNDLWVVPIAVGEPRKVTSGRGPVSLPAWSPDGQSLAYIGHERGHMPGANNRLLVVPAAPASSAPVPSDVLGVLMGGAARDLTAGFDRSVGNAVMGDTRMGFDGQRPAWAPDGKSVLFVSTDHGNTAIYRATLDGEISTVIGGERACAAFDTSRDGRTIAFAVSTPTLPGEIFAADGDGGNERQVTRHNEALLGELALQPAERIEYASAGGQRIEGWVIKPAGFDPARQYPLMLKIHGGPHGTYGNAFSHEFQLLVAQGYALLYVNPRGSQGYGQDFAHAIRADWGNLDYQDIMAGVDHVIGQGYVDPERLAAGGASYGGYMTCWLLGHTDRFKAIVTERVVSNLASFWGTSDIGQTFGAWEMGGKTPREDPETYARCSPITTMDRATTPALIICGERDLRCPMEQSEQVFITLKRNGVPAELVRYPDESHNHAVAGQPKHRVDRLERMLAWLGRYVPNDE